MVVLLRMTIAVLRWMLVPAAAVAGWLAGLVGAALLTVALHLALLAAGGALAPDIRLAIVGAVAAIGTVLGACVAAPSARRAVAVLSFAAGVWVAWRLLGHWYFPESHPRAYSRSHIPFVGTVLGGVGGVLLVWSRRATAVLSRWRRAAEQSAAGDVRPGIASE